MRPIPTLGWSTASYGDCIMATSQSRGHFAVCGRKVAFGDSRYVEWSEIFAGNPNVAHPIEVARGDPVDWISNFGGCRPYIDYTISSHERQVYNDWKASPGELYLSESETTCAEHTIRRMFSDKYVVVAPHTKNDCGGNKNWYLDRWEQVVALIDLPIVQLGLPGQKKLSKAFQVPTPSFRRAAAILSKATAFLGTEGALHHAAGALAVPAVVLFGGFVHPRNTGYEFHRNIVKTAEPCGRRTLCLHCRAAMAAISVEEVLAEIDLIVPGVVRRPAGGKLSSVSATWNLRPLKYLRAEIDSALPAFDFSTIIECLQIVRKRRAATDREILLLAAAFAAAGDTRSAEKLLNLRRRKAGFEGLRLRLLVTVKQQKNLHAEAARLGMRCLAMGVEEPGLYFQIGRAFQMAGRVRKSTDYFRAAALRQPANPDAWSEYGKMLFLQGRFKEAELFVTTVRLKEHFRGFSGGLEIPWWTPNTERSARLLVWPIDFGIGSQVMFATLYPELSMKYPNLVVACDARLLHVLRTAFPEVTFVTELQAIGMAARSSFSAMATPLCLLPTVRPSVDSFKPFDRMLDTPIDAAMVRQKYLQEKCSLVIGVSWFGGITISDQMTRSVPIENWGCIFSTPNVKFVSLQYDPQMRGYLQQSTRFSVARDIAFAEKHFGVKMLADGEEDKIELLLSKIASCDRVISVDNASAVLAGALGKPTLLLTAASPAWPLQTRRTSSIWFSSIRLLRQQSVGDWQRVMNRAAVYLSRVNKDGEGVRSGA